MVDRLDEGAIPSSSTINTLRQSMKYKMVVKAGDKTFVKARSKNKEHLEKRAIALTKKKPYMTAYIVENDTKI
jgi:hypothetical protein